MKKLILYASLVCMAMVSCSKDYVVDEENLPSWLGESIYGELKNPKSLNGTFNTYLRLIDDMGYADVLGKTGSKTIFPANDEAFEAYFKDGNNRFGATSYDQLTYNQKAQLLYCSMLDNAILIGNLSTEQNSAGELLQGKAVKHQTNISLSNSVDVMYEQNYPANNIFFDKFRTNNEETAKAKGAINVICDNTKAPMVHFTGEYMLNNSMTVTGENSDFKVITGNDYSDGDAYVFNCKVINSNITCQNGYIHQIDNVMDPPGNMAQVLRDEKTAGTGTSFFSRMMDYFCAPFYDATTLNNYNAWAQGQENTPVLDNLYAIRYFSQNSQAAKLDRYTDEEGKISNIHTSGQLLNFDPGWNYYKPTTNGTESYNSEIAAILAPTDNALWEYFKENGGGGAYIIKNLGDQSLANTYENLGAHFDAIYNNDPTVFANMLNNLMKAYFSKTVPSKFATVQNDAFEFMNVTLDDIQKKDDGNYDVRIANNGVIYKMNKFFAPQLYNSVLGPASVYQNMRCMGQMLNDHAVTAGTPSTLGADMYYYLLSMKSKYAVFVPEDGESFVYIDPLSIYDTDGIKGLRFTFDTSITDNTFNVTVLKGYYQDGRFVEVAGAEEQNIALGTYKTQIQDMLNYHTIVLPSNKDGLYGNHFYKTKHGGAIFVPDGLARNNAKVYGGAQIDGQADAATVKTQYSRTGNTDADPEANLENGTCYLINTPIQPALTSTYKVLSSKFEKFTELMEGFEAYSGILTFAGISDVVNTNTNKSEQTAYMMFESTNINTTQPELNNSRMRMLSAYNYTVYAPTDEAMDAAYAAGLPTWDEVEAIFNEWEDKKDQAGYDDAVAQVRAMIDVMRSFVFYHIQNSSVFADNVVSSGVYQTFCTDKLGIAQTLTISGGDGVLKVKDAEGKTVSVTYGAALSNILARDVVKKGSDIDYSSFVTIHGISTPLCFNASGRFDDGLTTAGAKATKH